MGFQEKKGHKIEMKRQNRWIMKRSLSQSYHFHNRGDPIPFDVQWIYANTDKPLWESFCAYLSYLRLCRRREGSTLNYGAHCLDFNSPETDSLREPHFFDPEFETQDSLRQVIAFRDRDGF